MAVALLVAASARAQVSLPCADGSRPGVPACGTDQLLEPIALERVFAEDFERGLSFGVSGRVSRDAEGPRSGGYAARLEADGGITAVIPLINRTAPLVEFAMAPVGLGPGATAVAEYHDGAGWQPLLRLTKDAGAAGLTAYRFRLPHLVNVAEFGLRFRLTGSAGVLYVDDVSVWAPRLIPPP
jgi:hypothetical protein